MQVRGVSGNEFRDVLGPCQGCTVGLIGSQTKRTKTKPFAICFRSEGHEALRNDPGAFGFSARFYRTLFYRTRGRTHRARCGAGNARGWTENARVRAGEGGVRAGGGGLTEERGLGVRTAKRIAVLGNAGGGKSTLSLQLSERLGVPYHSVDKAPWLPGWRPVAGPDFARLHGAWLSEPGWVIDGWGDMALIEERLSSADAVVLVQHPLWRHCFWALKRQCGGVFFERTDGPAGCRLLPKTWQLVKAMRWIHLYGLPELKRQISARCKPEAVYHVGSPRQLVALASALAPP